jgi:hypothetical protein
MAKGHPWRSSPDAREREEDAAAFLAPEPAGALPRKDALGARDPLRQTQKSVLIQKAVAGVHDAWRST